jgi:hypothetical protein
MLERFAKLLVDNKFAVTKSTNFPPSFLFLLCGQGERLTILVGGFLIKEESGLLKALLAVAHSTEFAVVHFAPLLKLVLAGATGTLGYGLRFCLRDEEYRVLLRVAERQVIQHEVSRHLEKVLDLVILMLTRLHSVCSLWLEGF